MNKKYKRCKDCNKTIPYVRQQVRCDECKKARNIRMETLRNQRKLGGVPMIIRNGKIQYERRIRYNKEVQVTDDDLIASDDDDEGNWVRIQQYNFKYGIVEYEEADERRKKDYKHWIEANL